MVLDVLLDSLLDVDVVGFKPTQGFLLDRQMTTLLHRI